MKTKFTFLFDHKHFLGEMAVAFLNSENRRFFGKFFSIMINYIIILGGEGGQKSCKHG